MIAPDTKANVSEPMTIARSELDEDMELEPVPIVSVCGGVEINCCH